MRAGHLHSLPHRYGSDGYMDPSMLSGRDASGSALTDGFAVGVTLLVVLTNRVPFDIFTECEEEREEEFEDIDAAILADPTAGWLAHAAGVVKSMVRSRGSSLCHQSKLKRLKLMEAHQTLVRLLEEEGAAPSTSSGTAPPPPSPSPSPPPPPPPPPPAEQSALSKQVRGMRKGGAHEGLQRNVSNGFDAAMRRLEAVYGATEGDAPAGFEELINYWHSACGLSDAARHDLHVLRIWRNASDHHDSDRWRRDGPRSDGEAMALLERIGAAVDALEGRES